MHHSGSTNHVSSYQPFNSGSNHHYSPYTSDGVAFTGVSIDYTLDPQIISQINYNSLNRGEDVDWYRFFEEMKQLQKKSSKNVSETPSTTSNSQANPQKIMTKLTGYKIPIVHLNPVRSFLSSTLEPSNKKRKYLLPDESSESQSTRNNSGSTNDEVDILDEFVTSYLNSKPIGM